MRFWSCFFSKPVKIGDAFFGEMQFVKISTDPSKSYFECQRYFKPCRDTIDSGVTRSLSGPTQQQKDFFTQIESDYPLLVAKFIPLIEKQFGA